MVVDSGIFCVLGQVVCDLKPRRLVTYVYVSLWRYARICIEGAHREPKHFRMSIEFCVEARAAVRTKGLVLTGR